MAVETVFRFLAVRGGAKPPSDDAIGRRAVDYVVTGARPPLEQQILALPPEARSWRTIRRLAEEAREGPDYLADLAALPLDVKPIARWVDGHSTDALDSINVRAAIQQLFGQTAAKVAGSPQFAQSARQLAETLLSDALSDANQARRQDDIVQGIKLLKLINLAANEPSAVATTEQLGAMLGRMVVVIPFIDARDEEPGEPERVPDDRDEEDERRQEREERLRRLGEAHDELVRTMARPDAIRVETAKAVPQPVTPTLAHETTERLSAVEARLADLVLRMEERSAAGQRSDAPPTEVRETSRVSTSPTESQEAIDRRNAILEALIPREPTSSVASSVERPALSLDATAHRALSDHTKRALAELDLDPLTTDPFAAVATLETEMNSLAARVPADSAAHMVLHLGGMALDLKQLRRSMVPGHGKINPATLPTFAQCQMNAGVGDLLIVRQTLKAYEVAEFAHVENVLQGEAREREHRRLNIREEVVETEREQETESERNLQSTERYEMQNEAEKVARTDFQLEAGLQVTGSYGPSISFSASLNVGFSTSTEETQRKASSYSREVTEKTSERIRERVREERRRRLVEQIEEINIHRIKNDVSPKGHIRGIYRWLNKIYDAQIFNYGQRMMYEFVIPEPAAYFIYAMVENAPEDIGIEKPDPPTWLGSPLKPENLTRLNYQRYLAQYEVTTAKPPPPTYRHVAAFEKHEGKEDGHFHRATKIPVPQGYEATRAFVQAGFIRPDSRADRAFLKAFVGGYVTNPAGWVYFTTPYREELSFGIHSLYLWAFTTTVDVYCQLTTEGFATWQHETFAAITEAYLNKKAAYDERVAALAIQRGPQILGRNPLENRRLEREELKKLSLMAILQSSWLDVNSYYDTAEPMIDLTAACTNGSRIRFFENAFEWHNLTYVFYPYFWGRHARWIGALQMVDPDLDFAAFLRAGAARVQVPVRPGFERAVAYFCQTGLLWEGQDPPLIGDDLYVPIVDEISANLGKIEDGVPYPPGSGPWEVRVPTSLVLLQDLPEIPQIVDILTGNPVNVLPPNA